MSEFKRNLPAMFKIYLALEFWRRYHKPTLSINSFLYLGRSRYLYQWYALVTEAQAASA
ncbi:MAG: hypothetical protein M3329_05495 [Pseudomonadota bacterium]|nr:hypothetical protein [Pseudomonadota bacterium]